MSEVNEFLKDIERPEGKVDVFEQPLTETATEKVVDQKSEDDQVPDEIKNRRHRRLEEKLEKERLSNIQLAARLEAITEAQKFKTENPEADYLESVQRIYGTNSPEAKEATDLLARALKNVEERTYERAVSAFREEQKRAKEVEAQAEKEIETIVEDIEDTYGVDMSKESMRKGFLQFLHKLSPKDEHGDVKEIADHRAAWETFQSTLPKKDSRAREIASRSMSPTGASPESKLEEDANWRALKELGIF